MDWFKNRRAVLFGGMALALIAGLIIALLVTTNSAAPEGSPPASQGGLVVQTGRDDDIKLDPKRPLRCFVNGRFVGELPLSDCAQKNGVATGALDVGLDPSGALAATHDGGAKLTPLAADPHAADGEAMSTSDSDLYAMGQDQTAPKSGRKTSICWRYIDSQWTRVAGEIDLTACVRAIFAGHCASDGNALFGRWGERGLRSLAGRIDLTSEDGDYRPLTTQNFDCAVAPFG